MAPYYYSYSYSVESVENSLKRVLSFKNETGLFNFFYIFSFSPLSILWYFRDCIFLQFIYSSSPITGNSVKLQMCFYLPSCVFTSCRHSYAQCRPNCTFFLDLPLFLYFCLLLFFRLCLRSSSSVFYFLFASQFLFSWTYLPSFLGPFHYLLNFFLLCIFLIPWYLPPLIFSSPPSGPDSKQRFVRLVSPQILVIKCILIYDINLVRAARVHVSEL